MNFIKNVISFFRSIFSDRIVESTSSEINSVLEVRFQNGKYVLNSKNVNYSFGGLHVVFQKFFKRIKINEFKIDDVLILGLGAGSIVEILKNNYHLNCKITGVEKDPEVIKLAKKYFDIEKYDNIKIEINDAFDFLISNNKKYDLIIVDIYIDYKVPEKFESPEFLKLIKKSLSNKGLFVFNKMIFNEDNKKSAIKLFNLFIEIFGETQIIKIKKVIPNWLLVYKQSV